LCREAQEEEEMKKLRKGKPKIQSLFAPFKQELKNVTYEGTQSQMTNITDDHSISLQEVPHTTSHFHT
jgi:hypothetical protein